jgi:hypothetical protein
MSQIPQKRDNRYYLERLRADHPGIYADFQDGKFKNAAEAFVAAGLRKAKSPLDLLQSTWAKASVAEQDAFKALIGCAVPSTAISALPVPTGATVLVSGSLRRATGKQSLSPVLMTEVRRIMDRRELTTGAVMREIGKSPLDASLGMALGRGTLVQNDMVLALESWVQANAGS